MKTKHLILLFEELAKKEDQPLSHLGFRFIEEAMAEWQEDEKDKKPPKVTGSHKKKSAREFQITQRYLYDLYRRTVDMLDSGVEKARAHKDHLDIIAKFLGYDSLSAFMAYLDSTPPSQLLACEGCWWSYVRANAGTYILKAPVHIFRDPKSFRMRMNLKGKEREFEGDVHEVGGCLSAVLPVNAGKTLTLIFKLGNSQNFEVLQGVFCGISSAGDPIAGREILIKEPTMKYREMTWEKIPLNDPRLDARINAYFDVYEKNCLKINHVSSFSFDDLESS